MVGELAFFHFPPILTVIGNRKRVLADEALVLVHSGRVDKSGKLHSGSHIHGNGVGEPRQAVRIGCMPTGIRIPVNGKMGETGIRLFRRSA